VPGAAAKNAVREQQIFSTSLAFSRLVQAFCGSCGDTMSDRRLLLERALPLAILAVAILSVPVMMLGPLGLRRLDALREEKRRADADIARLSAEIRSLRAEVEQIKRDPAAVERVARDELGLLRQTELVFQFSR
jgi:cell division protein FtsB